MGITDTIVDGFRFTPPLVTTWVDKDILNRLYPLDATEQTAEGKTFNSSLF